MWVATTHDPLPGGELSMNKNTTAALAVVSALLAPIVVNAASRIEPPKPVVVAGGPASPSANLPIADGCTRHVRVVYAAAYQFPSRDCPMSISANEVGGPRD